MFSPTSTNLKGLYVLAPNVQGPFEGDADVPASVWDVSGDIAAPEGPFCPSEVPADNLLYTYGTMSGLWDGLKNIALPGERWRVSDFCKSCNCNAMQLIRCRMCFDFLCLDRCIPRPSTVTQEQMDLFICPQCWAQEFKKSKYEPFGKDGPPADYRGVGRPMPLSRDSLAYIVVVRYAGVRLPGSTPAVMFEYLKSINPGHAVLIDLPYQGLHTAKGANGYEDALATFITNGLYNGPHRVVIWFLGCWHKEQKQLVVGQGEHGFITAPTKQVLWRLLPQVLWDQLRARVGRKNYMLVLAMGGCGHPVIRAGQVPPTIEFIEAARIVTSLTITQPVFSWSHTVHLGLGIAQHFLCSDRGASSAIKRATRQCPPGVASPSFYLLERAGDKFQVTSYLAHDGADLFWGTRIPFQCELCRRVGCMTKVPRKRAWREALQSDTAGEDGRYFACGACGNDKGYMYFLALYPPAPDYKGHGGAYSKASRQWTHQGGVTELGVLEAWKQEEDGRRVRM
ncbi:hypothetical protein K525DRAFT_273009 [Schizophyllum commune Loenen D]|nr:hypothetical protein K525DRAFT_273009 [Schizophyllum commune Loenen D]